MQATRLIASEFNALNRQMHTVAEELAAGDWLRRSVPGTNLPAFTFWHITRVIDATVNLGLRAIPEVIASEPWVSKGWARPGMGTGFTREEADAVAAQAVPAEVLAYADALRSQVNQWLRALQDDELDAPVSLLDRMRAAPAYDNPDVLDATGPFEGQPTWLLLTFGCFTHGWGHLEEIRLLTSAGH